MTNAVAITGATGFIGRTLLHRLAGGPWQIRALRRRRDHDPVHGVQWIQGDLHDIEALRQLTENASAVIHCAGRVRGRNSGQFYRGNVEGTANLVRACAGKPAPRFLLISSLAARQPAISWYAESKKQAEKALSELAGNMPWTVFRPTAVYGPGDRELSPLFHLSRYGILPVPGTDGARFSFLHVDDLVAAMLCWLDSHDPVKGIFELDDGLPGGYDGHQLATITAQAVGRRVHTLKVPPPLLSMTAFLNLWLAGILRYSPMLTPGKVRELLHPDWKCDNGPLYEALPAWQPRISLSDALPGLIRENRN